MSMSSKQASAASSTTTADAGRKGAPTKKRKQGRHRLWLKLSAVALGVYLAVLVGLVVHWCKQPPTFDVTARVEQEAAALGGEPRPGAAMVTAAIGVGETLLEKPGGFIHNDRLPPGLFLDDCPSWECGVLMALRDAVRTLRNDFTRAQTQSAENLDIKRAETRFAIDQGAWLFPAPEDEYREGIEALRDYLADLSTGRLTSGLFLPRPENLSAYLALVEKRLGHFGVRLSASIADADLTDMLGDGAGQILSGGMADQPLDQTPSNEVDDVFYCARGYSWAFLHFVQAFAIDFAPALEDRDAFSIVQQMERDLRRAIKPMSSPVVLNGNGYGILANHSLVIASYVGRVNASVIDLRLLLQQG